MERSECIVQLTDCGRLSDINSAHKRQLHIKEPTKTYVEGIKGSLSISPVKRNRDILLRSRELGGGSVLNVSSAGLDSGSSCFGSKTELLDNTGSSEKGK